MNKFSKFLLTLMIFFLPIQGIGQSRHTVSGTITDEQSGEVLIGATIFIPGENLGTISNTYGFYSITIPENSKALVCSYVGYDSKQFPLRLSENMTLNIRLKEGSTDLEEVVVKAEKPDHNLRSTTIGVEKLNVTTLTKVPVLLGEKDLLKTLQLMPGISTISEGSTGFSVRGGSLDQNLILLDEAPVYSAAHLMGFFSVFNADVIKDVTVYKGGIPANFGGRAASVVDIRMKDGNNQQFSASGGIGLISSRLAVEGPIIKDKASFILSGRRSYADLLAAGSGLLEAGTSLYFYDLNAKINIRINDKNRIYFSAYTGKDDFGFDVFGTDWGNITGTLRWNHLFGNRLFSNTTLIYSNYDYGFKIGEDHHMSSGIEDFGFKEDFTFFMNPKNTMKFGLSSTYHTFNPGKLTSSGDDGEYETILDEKFAIESGLYFSNESKFSDRFSAEYGLRLSMFNQVGEGTVYTYDQFNNRVDSSRFAAGEIMQTYASLEPRVSINYRLTGNTSLKASYNRITQYLHLLSNSTAGQPTDTWVPSTKNLAPTTVNQYSTGYFRNFLDNKMEFSVESYFKAMRNVTDYENGANLLLNSDVEASIATGEGRSYGMELSLEKKQGKVNGWVSYTLARTENLIEAIAPHWYPATYDKTHDFSVVVNYDLAKRVSLSAAWIYYTGNAVTFPSGKYKYDDRYISYYTGRNEYRMPDYHRLDINIHLQGKERKRWESSWDLSAYNVYNRYNAYSIYFEESQTVPGTTQAVKLSLFGIVPSVTWNFKF
jgi:hypothetical protein